jgi:hypothetical protein
MRTKLLAFILLCASLPIFAQTINTDSALTLGGRERQLY